mgnify:CR=1 FL=1
MMHPLEILLKDEFLTVRIEKFPAWLFWSQPDKKWTVRYQYYDDIAKTIYKGDSLDEAIEILRWV